MKDLTSPWTSWFIVQPEETGIVQRFGKVIRRAGPGLHFKLPYGFENVRLLPTARVPKEEFVFRTVSAVPGEKTRYDTRGEYKDESRQDKERTINKAQEQANREIPKARGGWRHKASVSPKVTHWNALTGPRVKPPVLRPF